MAGANHAFIDELAISAEDQAWIDCASDDVGCFRVSHGEDKIAQLCRLVYSLRNYFSILFRAPSRAS
jgi:hypothetical protein